MGTHYSTTHPPPLSQNSTSSYCSFSFSFSPPSVHVGPARLSLALSLSFTSRAPLPPLLGGWFFRLAPPSVPLSTPLSLFLSAHPARHGEAVFVHTAHVLVALVCWSHVYTCARARTEHTRVASSFHSISRSIPLLFSVGLSLCLCLCLCLSPPLLLLRRFSAKRNPRM